MKWFSWLPFMPKGDGPLGLAYLEDARVNGDLHRWDARFILLNIKTYLAPDYDEALLLARGLYERFPENSLFHFEVIEVLTERGDWNQVIAETTKLENHPGTHYHDEGRRRMAAVWRAGAELELGRPDRAWAELERFGDELPEQPTWAAAWITLQRGRTLDVMGKRDEAETHYERVTAFKPPRHNHRAAELAREGLEAPYAISESSAAAE
jgi:tetratricopeptide (TPR) repeat protein